ncbi:MAG: CotH kinase family protein [Flavobacteriales bacterium]|nr:CotH kinase family protein [Flavobacteriales bacterium]
MWKKEITKSVRRKRLFRLVALVLLAIVAFPLYHTYQYLKSDRKLRSYIKYTTIPAVANRMFGADQKDSTFLLSHPAPLDFDQIALQIEDSIWNLLQNDLDNKLATPHIIQNNINPWRVAVIRYEGEDMPCKVKLRGDTRDNYQYGLKNATFRINLQGDKTIKNCKKFSLIRPFHENGLYGMIYYDYARKSGILSNEFEFVSVDLRNEKSGVWIFQEAFHSAMLANQKAGKGLILKFENDCNERSNVYNASGFPKIIAYNMGSVREDSALHHQFQLAVRNLQELHVGKTQLSEVLELDLWANFVAINDLFYGHHSMTCHNMRLYYNPKSNKIEPVAWDPFCYRFLPYSHPHQYFASQKMGVSPIYSQLQADSDFNNQYKLALQKLVNNKSLDTYLAECVEMNKVIGPLLHRPIVTPGFDLQVIEETRKVLKLQLYTMHPLRVNVFKNEHKIEIMNTSLLPVYCEKCVLEDTVIIVDKVITESAEVHHNLSDSEDVYCVFRHNLLDSMLVEQGEIYNVKVD